jgi:hypothetical protein
MFHFEVVNANQTEDLSLNKTEDPSLNKTIYFALDNIDVFDRHCDGE